MAQNRGRRIGTGWNRRLNQRLSRSRPILWAALILLTILSCTVSGVTTAPTLTPPPAPTPAGNTFYFNAPYTITLPPQTRVPGTRIFYSGRQEGFYEFRIDGLVARHVANDSLPWRGVIAPGVAGDYRLTVQSGSGEQVVLNGTVRVAVLFPAPVEVPISALPGTLPDFSNIPIDYVVPQGEIVPGATLRFDGAQDGSAILSGGSGLPTYPLGNSVIYSGRLRSNVIIRYDLVVSRLDDVGVGLSGTARVWITDLVK